ncbi:MAG: TRAP transporter substrate-binding protein [Thermodesulfobacteriota bacterium]
MKKWLVILLVLALALLFVISNVSTAAEDKAAKWKPTFDPSGAKYKIIYSNVSHPDIKGVFTGYAIRDELWKRTNGQMYFDYRPFSQLGAEVEVLNQVVTGTIQGMSCSSVAAPTMGPPMGLVNLPYLVDTYEKMEKFAADKKLFGQYLASMESKGVLGVNVTGYGQYGWATTKPVKTLDDAKKVKFRIAPAPVNKLTYQAWGINPVVMPWPEVHTALQQGVIDGLDHTALVCVLERKFEIAKFFTELNYAQGLFIWLVNKAWYNSLPPDLGKTFMDVMNEQCTKMRAETKKQQEDTIATAKKEMGVEFIKLPAKDMETLRQQGKAVHEKYAAEIGPEFLKAVQQLLDFK